MATSPGGTKIMSGAEIDGANEAGTSRSPTRAHTLTENRWQALTDLRI